jgi:hypothetical protein
MVARTAALGTLFQVKQSCMGQPDPRFSACDVCIPGRDHTRRRPKDGSGKFGELSGIHPLAPHAFQGLPWHKPSRSAETGSHGRPKGLAATDRPLWEAQTDEQAASFPSALGLAVNACQSRNKVIYQKRKITLNCRARATDQDVIPTSVALWCQNSPRERA